MTRNPPEFDKCFEDPRSSTSTVMTCARTHIYFTVNIKSIVNIHTGKSIVWVYSNVQIGFDFASSLQVFITIAIKFHLN